MLTKYCSTRFEGEYMACGVGWGSVDSKGSQSCQDKPVEENCRNLIDPSNMYCPFCDTPIENPFSDCLGIPQGDGRVLWKSPKKRG